MLTPDVLRATIVLLDRVQLSGSEAFAFCKIVEQLSIEEQRLLQLAEEKSKPQPDGSNVTRLNQTS